MNTQTGSKIDWETHSIAQPTAERSQHQSWLGKLHQAIVKAFEPHTEPMFWKKRDRNGNVYWQGYDPASNRSIEFGSDDEARHWLDRSQPFR
jgi:YD repeat-containing protein